MIKKNPFNFLLLLSLTLVFSFQVNAQQEYRNHQEITKKLKSIQSKNNSNVKLKSLIKTVGGYDIWALTLFKGEAANKPAIAIVGGVDGGYLLSTEMAVNIAENLLEDHSDLLDKTTFYIFPNMSPNTTEKYFGNLKNHHYGNAKKTDDDRDGLFNEDPNEDLNGDGLITTMRIEDVTGDYIQLKEDARIMVKADKTKGEIGEYKILSEGIDNDKDGFFNEDGEGGVHFNKNLSYNYQYFKPGTGEHPVSEMEHRALLDFLYEQWNIFSVVTLGPDNNLSNPLKHNKSGASKRVVTSVLKNDAILNTYLSEKYIKIIDDKNAPKSKIEGGGFFEWSYFHFGKLALSTPGWWPPKFEGDTINKAPKNVKANYLKWAEEANVENAFVNWTSIQHPDFPNKKVEIGGFTPFKMNNPPYEKVAEISKKHTDFIVQLAEIQPNIKIENVVTEKVSNKLTRITLDIYNAGYLPTHTDMGKKSRWLRKIKVAVQLNKNQEIISGKKIELLDSIDGDSFKTLTWLIQGAGSVTFEAGASHTGEASTSINLK